MSPVPSSLLACRGSDRLASRAETVKGSVRGRPQPGAPARPSRGNGSTRSCRACLSRRQKEQILPRALSAFEREAVSPSGRTELAEPSVCQERPRLRVGNCRRHRSRALPGAPEEIRRPGSLSSLGRAGSACRFQRWPSAAPRADSAPPNDIAAAGPKRPLGDSRPQGPSPQVHPGLERHPFLQLSILYTERAAAVLQTRKSKSIPSASVAWEISFEQVLPCACALPGEKR